MEFVFLGTKADLGSFAKPNNVSKVGQVVDIKDDMIKTMMKMHVPIIPRTQWDSLNVTHEELTNGFSTALHHKAMPSFLEKYEKALVMLTDFRNETLKDEEY